MVFLHLRSPFLRATSYSLEMMAMKTSRVGCHFCRMFYSTAARLEASSALHPAVPVWSWPSIQS